MVWLWFALCSIVWLLFVFDFVVCLLADVDYLFCYFNIVCTDAVLFVIIVVLSITD